ncbi:hypothetical protein CEP54_014658 [Fusarium duplospermum]|uniref:Uncharacterized protein n=1 Tax=Fusarium duplospermum TaxID=1325734 RepID=A0A428NUK4_9HYPO|nr:hypothetical protein CEP54_014658 [Fusarium duplospermum]
MNTSADAGPSRHVTIASQPRSAAGVPLHGPAFQTLTKFPSWPQHMTRMCVRTGLSDGSYEHDLSDARSRP